MSINGVDPRRGRPFIWHLFHARGGGGASSVADGWSTVGEFHTVGSMKFPSVEVAEARFRMFIGRHEFRPDSGGRGQFRGGMGGVLDLRFDTLAPATANTAGDGVFNGPFGLFGGKPGQPHRFRIISGRRVRVLTSKEVGIPIRPGDRLLIESAGGGGYGTPAERDPARVAEDVRNGLVTAGGRSAKPPRRGRTGKLDRR